MVSVIAMFAIFMAIKISAAVVIEVPVAIPIPSAVSIPIVSSVSIPSTVSVPIVSAVAIEVGIVAPIAATNENPLPGNPITIGQISGFPCVSISGAWRNISHRPANIKPKFGCLGRGRSKAQPAGH